MTGRGAIPLGGGDLAIAAGLVLLAGTVSLVLRLGLERRLAVASARTVIQLLLVGHILRFVFQVQTVWAIAAIALLMVAVAARTAVARPARTYARAGTHAFVTLVLTGLITTTAVTATVIRVDPWYHPQYLIPLLGMVLGNGLNGISLSLDHLLEAFVTRQAEVEMELSLGASRWEAARDPIREAVRRGMIPIVNTMTIVGIVSLPGMMTGQILAGADPVEAVLYQIVVMFTLAGATALGCMSLALLAYRRLFDAAHRLRLDRVLQRPG